MAREKDGYRDALERIRSQAAGELVTVSEAARIVYGPDDTRRQAESLPAVHRLDRRRPRQAHPRHRTGKTNLLNLKGEFYAHKQRGRPGVGAPERPKT